MSTSTAIATSFTPQISHAVMTIRMKPPKPRGQAVNDNVENAHPVTQFLPAMEGRAFHAGAIEG